MNPLCIATTPSVMFVYLLSTKPTSSIICFSSSWLRNRSMLSTRYWYDSESPVIAFPIWGITKNEYCRYNSFRIGFCTLLNYRHMKRPPFLRTLLASWSAFLVLGTFLSPNEMV